MAYLKMFRVVQDSPVTYQMLNQLADNQADFRQQLFIEHGTEEALISGSPASGPPFSYHRLGRHDIDEIPRTVGQAALYLQSSPSTGLTTNINFTWTGPGIPFITKIGDGDFLLPVVGLEQGKWWATACVGAGNTVTMLQPQVRPFEASAANGNTAGIRVCTYKLDSGDFVPFDASFCISLYGKVA